MKTPQTNTTKARRLMYKINNNEKKNNLFQSVVTDLETQPLIIITTIAAVLALLHYRIVYVQRNGTEKKPWTQARPLVRNP
jgi:predicted permease